MFRAIIQNTVFCLFLMVVVANLYAVESYNGEQNIDELIQQAGAEFDIEETDAVVLYQSERYVWQTDKRLVHEFHRIMYLNSAWAVSHYADSRIPFDSENSTFKVKALRTWRDDQWWETDSTGMVETLPGQLRICYDYVNLREMVLMHDGIEIPCVVELAYEIEDKKTFRNGAWGVHSFSADIPVVFSELMIDMPKGRKLNHHSTGEVVELPAKIIKHESENPGVSNDLTTFDTFDRYVFSINFPDQLPLDYSDNQVQYLPHVTWSTYRNWSNLGSHLRKTFERSMRLSEALKDSVKEITEESFSVNQTAKKISSFVERHISHVNYPNHFWIEEPRDASRTFETAYGHSLDRSVLAAALFEEAGFMIFPIMRGLGCHDINEGVPALDKMTDIGVWISSADEVEAYFDPASCRLSNGLSPIFGKTVWIPGSGDEPTINWRGDANLSNLVIKLKLEFEEKNDRWMGKGFYRAEQGFCPYDKMEGLEKQSQLHLKSVIASILGDIELKQYNFTTFSRFNITAGFSFVLDPGEEDRFGRHALRIDQPKGGALDMLNTALEFHRRTIDLPVLINGIMHEEIEISIEIDEEHIISLPDDQLIENDLMKFAVESDVKPEKTVVSRVFDLKMVKVSPDSWSEFRDAILSFENEKNEKILFKK